jgi:predicted small lipoprotein YifL
LRHRRSGLAVLALLLLLTLSACGGNGDVTAPTEAEQTAAEQAAAEAQAAAEQEEAGEQAQAPAEPAEPEVPEEFSSDRPPVYQAPTEPAAAPEREIPYEEAFPPPPPKDTLVRVSVLSHANAPQTGERIALVIGTLQKERLEKRLGKEVRLIVTSRGHQRNLRGSVVQFREGYLDAAMAIASTLSDAQHVEPMPQEESEREGIDVLILAGR